MIFPFYIYDPGLGESAQRERRLYCGSLDVLAFFNLVLRFFFTSSLLYLIRADALVLLGTPRFSLTLHRSRLVEMSFVVLRSFPEEQKSCEVWAVVSSTTTPITDE